MGKNAYIKDPTIVELNKAKAKILEKDPHRQRLNTDDVIYLVLLEFNKTEGKKCQQ